MLQIVGSNTKNISGFYSNLNIEDVDPLNVDQSNTYTRFNRHFSTSNLQKNLIDDAIALLNADHDYLSYLFFTYENSTNTTEKTLLLTQVCTELLLHRQVEEEVFYPAAKLALLNDGYLIDEPIIEHNGLIALIADIQQSNDAYAENLESNTNLKFDSLKEDSFKNKVDILAEYVKYHIKQEREYIFPKIARGEY